MPVMPGMNAQQIAANAAFLRSVPNLNPFVLGNLYTGASLFPGGMYNGYGRSSAYLGGMSSAYGQGASRANSYGSGGSGGYSGSGGSSGYPSNSGADYGSGAAWAPNADSSTMPPYALSYNPYGIGLGSATQSPYGSGYSNSTSTNPSMPSYADPSSGSLWGVADATSALGNYSVTIQRSRLLIEEVKWSPFGTRWTIRDEACYERMQKPTSGDVRQ
jgi:hypothetical protein